MTLRWRLYIAAGILLSVVGLLGVLLVRSVEHSELEQIDQQLKTAAPVVGSFDRSTVTRDPIARFVPKFRQPATESASSISRS